MVTVADFLCNTTPVFQTFPHSVCVSIWNRSTNIYIFVTVMLTLFAKHVHVILFMKESIWYWTVTCNLCEHSKVNLYIKACCHSKAVYRLQHYMLIRKAKVWQHIHREKIRHLFINFPKFIGWNDGPLMRWLIITDWWFFNFIYIYLFPTYCLICKYININQGSKTTVLHACEYNVSVKIHISGRCLMIS